MDSPLDNAIKDAAAAEGTYTADLTNVATIQTSIDTATAPLAPAKAQLVTDAANFNSKLDALSAAALAAKVTPPA
jgi:hypothetical protein